MRVVDIITKKRGNILNPQGEELTKEEIAFLIDNYCNGNIPDYQISAWLMAVYFNGMTFQETANLTNSMLHSGDVIDLKNTDTLKGSFVDKHSTGGVGDKISLPLAPIVAACGAKVPMMSGRALGHTGGTLDKLDSITGYRSRLNSDEFRYVLAQCGFAMTGQTKEIVPADRLLYALRDVTGTVESIPLITASILSKKVAEGSDCLVFDVKFGSGAFMKTPEAAENLANSLVKTAHTMDKKASAILTNMNTPLGRKIGNFLEIEETIECLQGNGPKDVMDVTFALGAEMLTHVGLAKSFEDGVELCKKQITNGKALELFLKNVELQGGDTKKLMADVGKRRSVYMRKIIAKENGYLSLDAYKTGLASVSLGVGRSKTDDDVFADAGIILHFIEGDKVKAGDVLMEVFGKDEKCFDSSLPILENAIKITFEKVQTTPLILKTLR
ncbi:MAG: thymidine phosphorylase [Treponema sp.]|nr:thymidine phosphorylase [Treponema sp.]